MAAPKEVSVTLFSLVRAIYQRVDRPDYGHNPANELAVDRFLAMPPGDQATLLASFHDTLEILEAGARVTDRRDANRVMLSLWLTRRGLTIHPAFYRRIESEDLVEVYDAQTLRQIYRNDRFLASTSYDLTALELLPMGELWTRDEAVFGQIVARAMHVLVNQERGLRWEVEPYIVAEKFNPARGHARATPLYIDPVFDVQTGAPVGFISTVRFEDVVLVSVRKNDDHL